jgi:hypothetical protein
MAFMDKAKQKAAELAEQAQRGVQQGQQKLDERAKRKQLEQAAAQLGWATYRGRTQGGVDETELARLTSRIADLEAELAALIASATQGTSGGWTAGRYGRQQGWGPGTTADRAGGTFTSTGTGTTSTGTGAGTGSGTGGSTWDSAHSSDPARHDQP